MRIELPKLHTNQQIIKDYKSRFKIVSCGRRFGKTILGIDTLVNTMLMGYPCTWMSPTYKMLNESWRDVKRICAPIIKEISEQDKRIKLITEGSVEFWSLESYDSIRGRKYALAVLDEAAMCSELEQAWNAAIRPTLSDYRGLAWFLSTPRGHNFFWRLFSRGLDDCERDWASWQMPTASNPYISTDEIEAARLELPEIIFNQEYLAQFIDEAGGVFRGVQEVIKRGKVAPIPAVKNERYIIGCDIARVMDYTVMTVLNQQREQIFFERMREISWERQISMIKNVATLYNNACVVLDSTGVGDPIREQLVKSGVHVIPYHFTNQSKSQIIDSLSIVIEQKSISLMDIPIQTNELLAYEYDVTKTGLIRTNAPSGMHDDCVISLALANHGFNKNMGQLFIMSA